MISAVIAVRISECTPFLRDALTLGQEGRVDEEGEEEEEEGGATAAAAAAACSCCCCCFFG